MKARTRPALHALCALCALALSAALPTPAHAVTEIKIATIAPRGSAWMRVYSKMKARITKRTGGEVRLRFYPGQVMGDERDVVRKMRSGQLQGGIFTSVGLSLINPRVLVLQMPLMFQSYASLDRVRKALAPRFEQTFRKKGYELLGWGDVGMIYLFSKSPVRTSDDLKRLKVWSWSDDPISRAMLRNAGASPRILGLPQVYPALNTGMVDVVYNAPLGCLALQWHTRLKYYSDMPLAIGIGAMVITNATFKALTSSQKEILKAESTRAHRILARRIRRDNVKALKVLQQNGLKPVKVGPAGRRQFQQSAEKVAQSFAPRYYPKALLKRVLELR
jgi:TRAP-type C4-dicarboxylate transport system substrate-binding protein